MDQFFDKNVISVIESYVSQCKVCGKYYTYSLGYITCGYFGFCSTRCDEYDYYHPKLIKVFDKDVVSIIEQYIHK